MKKKLILKIIISVLSVCIPFTVNAAEYVYKTLTLDIPDCEVTGGGIANIPPYDSLLLQGKNWSMGFYDQLFMKDCLSVSKRLGSALACEEQNRIEMLDSIIVKNSITARIFFGKTLDNKIKRQEFEHYILYSSVGPDKRDVAMLVEKLTGKTTDIRGVFSDKHLKWLRLTFLKQPFQGEK